MMDSSRKSESFSAGQSPHDWHDGAGDDNQK
jgi:hypothetical protein